MGPSKHHRRSINTTPLFVHVVKCFVALSIAAATQLLTPQSEALALMLSPKSLSFTGTQGSTNPPAQTVTFWEKGDRTKSWTIGSSVSWVTVNPSLGSLTIERDTITVDVTLAGLAPGNYTTSLMITTVDPKGRVRKTGVPVSLTVTPSASTTGFTASPASLAFSGTVGGPNTTGSVSVSNTSSTSLTVTWSEAVSWLIDVQPGSTQTIAAGQTATFTTTASPSGLAAGTYTGAITISGGGITKQVPVTLTVTGTTATPSIRLAPTSLAFSGTAGGTNPAAQTFALTNPTGGTLTWATSDNASWLALSAASGTTTTETDTVSAMVNLAGLAAGSYTATITVAATGAANSPQVIPVSLTLTANTTSSATLTWTANTESDLAGYKVYRSTASGTYGAALATLSNTATSYVFSGLQTGTTYFFVITAYDSAGNESPYSNEVSKSIF